ncbi:MAG: hypothetical protein ABI175_03675, partial [Polyangiales bacterium]
MERDARNPHAPAAGGKEASQTRAPGKMSLTESLGSAGKSAVAPKPAAAAGGGDKPDDKNQNRDPQVETAAQEQEEKQAQEHEHENEQENEQENAEQEGEDDGQGDRGKANKTDAKQQDPKAAKDDKADKGDKPDAAGPGKATAAGGPAQIAPAQQQQIPRLDLGRQKPEKQEGGEGNGAPGAAPAAAGAATASKAPAPAKDPNKSGITVAVTRKAAGGAATRTTVGVGEDVTFTLKDGGDWTVNGLPQGAGETLAWTAPSKPGPVEIVNTIKDQPPKKLTMNVIAPSGVEFKSKGGFPVVPAGVGMTTMVTVLPTTVSFGACEWQEEGGPQTGASGYFAKYIALGKGALPHDPAKGWIGMGDANNEVEDRAFSMEKPKLPHDDGTTRYWAGGFGWNIPNKYRVKGEGDGTTFATVRQQFTMADNGSMSVNKGAASATQNFDGTVVGEIEKYPTIGQAHKMLNKQGSRTNMIAAVMQYNMRADKDPESARNLIEALKQEDIQLYVHTRCNNTYNWVSRDTLTLTVKGGKAAKQSKFDINNKNLVNNANARPLTFALNDLLDLGTMTPS